MMPKLTIVSTYYNHPQMVQDQIAHWETLPADLRSQIEFILVDDCSAQPPLLPPTSLDLKIFRVTTDINWNQAGARNLATFHARGEWAMYFDIDQKLAVPPITHLVAALDQLDKKTLYLLQSKNLFDIDGTPVKVHPNTFVVNLPNFKIHGMWDEDFVGYYGYEDIYMLQAWKARGCATALMADADYFEDMGFATKGFSRDLTRNGALVQQKLQGGCKKPIGWMRFEWEPVALPVADESMIVPVALAG